MSALMEGGMMRSLLQGMMESEEDSDSLKIADLNLDEQLEMDTTFLFINSPDSIRQQFKDPSLLDRMRMQANISETNETMFFTFELDFKDISEIEDFYANLSALQEDNAVGANMLGKSSMLPLGQGKLFQLKKRNLERLPTKQMSAAFTDEEEEFAQLMFAGASYTTIYHLPGKVKKATHPAAIIEGNTVTIAVPMLDIMNQKADLGGTIKFKKK